MTSRPYGQAEGSIEHFERILHWRKRFHAMNVLYPAKSEQKLSAICEKLATVFGLPPFRMIHRSEYLETAQSERGPFEITVTEYLRSVNSEEAAQIGPPDRWNLAWRAAVGNQFNYQVRISRAAVTRNQQRNIARKLRKVFIEIKLHGDPADSQVSPD